VKSFESQESGLEVFDSFLVPACVEKEDTLVKLHVFEGEYILIVVTDTV